MRNFLKNLKNLIGIPTMTREWSENGPMTVAYKSESILSRFCLVSLILMTLGVGQVWGVKLYLIS